VNRPPFKMSLEQARLLVRAPIDVDERELRDKHDTVIAYASSVSEATAIATLLNNERFCTQAAEEGKILVGLSRTEIRDCINGLARASDDYKGPTRAGILELALRLCRVIGV
jgi:RNase H-fold protein (predicted Holliday junction resolvase)